MADIEPHLRTADTPPLGATDTPPLGFGEFVALIAFLMALTALGIDSMLPALPAIGRSLGVASANQRQFVISVFLTGFGVAQLVYGPLSDRYGRRPVLAGALLIYVVTNVLAAVSGSFTLLLIARFCGGAAIAASRVVTVALVRDCYSGRAMAQVMSFAMIVFMAAPVVAPMFGSAILLVGSWRLIFTLVAALTATALAWFLLRMPETLAREDRRPLSIARLVEGWRTVLTDRCSIGYTLASTALLGGLYGFINSIQQIVFDTFKRPELFIPVFASTAGAMAIANFANSRLVMRLGTRRISHWALAGTTAFAAIHLAVDWAGYETLAAFVVLQALMMACYGMSTSNFSAMAMERMGHMAGMASSVQGFITITGGALLGGLIGQSFDGTTRPLYGGFVILGLLAFAFVAVTERGRLFRPQIV